MHTPNSVYKPIYSPDGTVREWLLREKRSQSRRRRKSSSLSKHLSKQQAARLARAHKEAQIATAGRAELARHVAMLKERRGPGKFPWKIPKPKQNPAREVLPVVIVAPPVPPSVTSRSVRTFKLRDPETGALIAVHLLSNGRLSTADV